MRAVFNHYLVRVRVGIGRGGRGVNTLASGREHDAKQARQCYIRKKQEHGRDGDKPRAKTRGRKKTRTWTRHGQRNGEEKEKAKTKDKKKKKKTK